ncbi:MAG: hypothetical protein M0Q53_00100 [Prolixibacteraceae bacterium]|nr:hypothetical protein [Prolixibacteraceae bacterium]
MTFLVATGVLLFCLNNCLQKKRYGAGADNRGNIDIGWASADITPDQPVDIRGQFTARISDGILDPVTVTALAIESRNDTSSAKVILVSCDLITIEKELLDAVRMKIKESVPEIDPTQIIINATHTHTAPYCSTDMDTRNRYGIVLDVMAPSDYFEFVVERISETVKKAWSNRKPGGISCGLGHAVVGHNRLAVDFSGKSVLYGNTNREEFSHIEGYEDHTVNLLYTWDKDSKLTGVLINIACPSQATETLNKISADFWHETRIELGNRLGGDVFILPQCSAAGDQSPHPLFGDKAEERMQRIMFSPINETGEYNIGLRKQIAKQIADAVTSVLPYMSNNIEWNPVIKYQMEVVELSRRLIAVGDVGKAMNESMEWKKRYEQLLQEVNENSDIKNIPGWYSDITVTYRRMTRGQSVKDRYELGKVQPKIPVEIHVLRIGDMVMATNPFELYVDFGMRIKARSPATQTFLVQLSNGSFGYLPPSRSTTGRSYGAEPASTLVGPEGGQELVNKTLGIINKVME